MSGRSVSDLSIPANILKNKDVSELEKLQEDDAHFVEFFSALELDNVRRVLRERESQRERERQRRKTEGRKEGGRKEMEGEKERERYTGREGRRERGI